MDLKEERAEIREDGDARLKVKEEKKEEKGLPLVSLILASACYLGQWECRGYIVWKQQSQIRFVKMKTSPYACF